MAMRDQNIYREMGQLLWSIMPDDVKDIYFFGDIYPSAQGNTITFQKKSGELSWFSFGTSPESVSKKIMILAKELQGLPPFKREQPWSHFKVTLTEQGKFKIDFAYIPQEDSWPGLFMKGVSQLSWEEAKKHHIPENVWRHRQKVDIQPDS